MPNDNAMFTLGVAAGGILILLGNAFLINILMDSCTSTYRLTCNLKYPHEIGLVILKSTLELVVLTKIVERFWKATNSITGPVFDWNLSVSVNVGEKLFLTKSQYRHKHINSATGRPYDKIVIGAAIFHPRNQKLCLLKRTAEEICYPNVFELPSGNVDDTDSSLMHALIREVKEETGFHVTKILAELDPFLYFTEKVVSGNMVRKSCVQLNYVVEVQGEVINVNPEEHSVGIWAGDGELAGLEMTAGMRGVVSKALKWKRG